MRVKQFFPFSELPHQADETECPQARSPEEGKSLSQNPLMTCLHRSGSELRSL